MIQSEQWAGALGEKWYWLMQWDRKTRKWHDVPDTHRKTKLQVQALAKRMFGITGL